MPEIVAGDWRRLRDELIARRLLNWRSRTGAAEQPSRVTIYALLALAWLSIRVLGFMPSIRLWRGTADSRLRRSFDGDEDLSEILRRVDLRIREIAATHLLCCQCKERSLVTWYVLRKRFRVSSTLVLGAMFYPFQAHAWVECDGLLLTDETDRCGEYLRVVEFE